MTAHDTLSSDLFQYSNANYTPAGCIIQQASRQSYGAYVGDHILAPLDMTHSFADRAAVDGSQPPTVAPSPRRPGPLAFARRHPLMSYFVLTYLITWTGWLPVILGQNGLGCFPWQLPFVALVGGGIAAGVLITAAPSPHDNPRFARNGRHGRPDNTPVPGETVAHHCGGTPALQALDRQV